MLTPDQDRLLWIRELKSGDKFAMSRRVIGGDVFDIFTVDRITPAQIVTLPLFESNPNSVYRFNRTTGREIGGNDWRTIQPITKEITEYVERKKLENWLNHLTKNAVPLEQLRAMKKAYDDVSR